MTGFRPGEPLDVRFDAVGADAVLTLDEVYVLLDDEGEPERWVRLLVDGQPFVALPRGAFLAAVQQALHDLEEPVQ